MSGIVFQPDSWIWINDSVDKFVPAKVLSSFSAGLPTVVLTEDGEESIFFACLICLSIYVLSYSIQYFRNENYQLKKVK